MRAGSKSWELYCLEHGLLPDGTITSPQKFDEGGARSFFDETESGKAASRALFVDLEPTYTGRITTTPFTQKTGS